MQKYRTVLEVCIYQEVQFVKPFLMNVPAHNIVPLIDYYFFHILYLAHIYGNAKLEISVGVIPRGDLQHSCGCNLELNILLYT